MFNLHVLLIIVVLINSDLGFENQFHPDPFPIILT